MNTPHPDHPPPGGRRSGMAGLSLGAALLVLALVAGLNFTFATAVMPNLAGVDDRTFVLVTQRFNENPVFPLTFTLALLLLVLTLAVQVATARGPAVRWTTVTLVLYIVVLVITGAFHLPLNDLVSQAGAPDEIADPAGLRQQFETPWVVGHAVRTLVCTAALGTLIRAALHHGRSG